jgi:dTDP-4-amino-4,6-dideoxygalactose transaminase
VSARLEREIEELVAARIGRPCLFCPSGRVALYLALRRWLSPGDRILMSPVTDDVIFFTVLAAGLRPVMAPVSPDDGNIEPTGLDESAWSALDGVLTTNLYGLPDRVQELRARCRQLRIPLIEDAAHAIETAVDGSPIGSFGQAAAFSLSKHVDAACGGVLAFGDEAERAELAQLRDACMAKREARERRIRVASAYTEALVVSLGLTWPARRARRTLGLAERSAYRMDLREQELAGAIAAGGGLARFHPWMRVDRHDYRVRPSNVLLARAVKRIRALDDDRMRRIEAVERLRSLPELAAGARVGSAQPLFRAPLLVEDRAALISRLERRVLNVGYIYDPPLDDYAGAAFADPSPEPAAARRWAAQVFPADPLEADAVLKAMTAEPA